MINRIDFEKLNAVTRLFTIYAEQGNDQIEAIKKTELKLGGRYFREFILLREVFDNENNQTKKIKPSEQTFFQSLKSDITASGGDSNKTLIELSKLMRATSSGFKACSLFYQTIYIYPMIIMALAIVVYTLYKLFVFDSMVSAFGSNMPKLSKFIFSDVISIVMLVVTILSGFFFVAAIRALQRNFALFKPNNGWFSKTLFCGDDQCYLLFLLYLKTLLNCDSNAQQSLEKSKKYAGITNFNTLFAYSAKQDVLSAISSESDDVISSEVGFQLNTVVAEMEATLVSKQESVLASFQIMIFVFIGMIIIAMYLPIFKLASVFS